MKKLYIAYGDNLNKGVMKFRVPGARLVSKSWINDHRLSFDSARANIVPAEGHDVPVVVWEIDSHHVSTLDMHMRGYRRHYMQVEVDGHLQPAMIYTMKPCQSGIPSDAHIASVAEGYHAFNFDIRILNNALLHAHANALHRARAI